MVSGTLAEASKNPKTKLITLDSFKLIITGPDGCIMFATWLLSVGSQVLKEEKRHITIELEWEFCFCNATTFWKIKTYVLLI
jgi:hypothetical protein